MTTKRMGCSQQITMCFDLFNLRKGLLQERGHDRLQFRTDTTTIKEDMTYSIRIQLRKEFTTENLNDDSPVLMERINALGMETL